MMSRRIPIVLIFVLVLSWLLGACSPEPTPPPLPTSAGEQGAGGQPQATEPSSGAEGGGEETGSQEEGGSEAPTEAPVASSIPIPEAAYNVHYSRGGESVQFTVDGDIDSVLTFFQEELPNYGWEMAGPPDNAVGVIATMLRENEAGDRLTVNMQENSDAGFVQVTVQVARAG